MDAKTAKKLRKNQIKILNEIIRICEEENIKYFLDYGTLLGAVRHKGYIPWDDDIDIGMFREDYEKFMKIAPKKLQDGFILCNYKTEKDYFLSFAKVRLKNTIMLEKENENLDINNGIWVDIFPYDNLSRPNSIFIKVRKKVFDVSTTLISIKLNLNYYKDEKKKKILKIIVKFLPLKLLHFIRNFACKININKNSNYICNLDEDKKELTYNGFVRSKMLPNKNVTFEGKEYKTCSEIDYVLTAKYGDYMKIPKKEDQKTHNPLIIKFEDGEVVEFKKE